MSLSVVLLGSTNNNAATLDTEHRNATKRHNEIVLKNRYVQNIIINCIRFCGSFELVLKGHGVFRGLINFSAQLDAAMKYPQKLQLSNI